MGNFQPGNQQQGRIVFVSVDFECHSLCQFDGSTLGCYDEHAASFTKDFVVDVNAHNGIGTKGTGA